MFDIETRQQIYDDVVGNAPPGPILDMLAKAWSVVGRHENIMAAISGGSDSDIVLDVLCKLDPDKRMLNTGESPNVEEESTLSQILEVNAPEKYYLSAKACEGILRRAERRGKQLPPMLKEALEQMIERERASEKTEDDSWMM